MTRNLITQCTADELKELNHWLPSMIDAIRRKRTREQMEFETLREGATIQ